MAETIILNDSDIHSESFYKTMDLRIIKGVLQQKLQGNLGSEIWEDVEIINK